MKEIAILLTVHNRIGKTQQCLQSLFSSGYTEHGLSIDVYLTDDGSTDGTARILREQFTCAPLHILPGDGNLFWNGGMLNSWAEAIRRKHYDGYLWLNNDTTVLPVLWEELIAAENHSIKKFARRGIYVGSTCGSSMSQLTYGGFNFTSRWTLRDVFLPPDGNFQNCQCGHGNMTYVSSDAVCELGLLDKRYRHGGGDHDYTYRAYRKGIPLFILRRFVGICDNDHKEDGYQDFMQKSLRQRAAFLFSPVGYNLHNALLFQRRFFPYRYPFALAGGILKVLFPKAYYRLYKWARR